jgi:hypothetical protein
MNLPQRSNLVTGASMQADQAQLHQSLQLQQAMEARRAEPQLPQTSAAAQQLMSQAANSESQQKLLASQLVLHAKDAIKVGPLQAGQLEGTTAALEIARQTPAGVDPRVYLLARAGMTA